MLTWIFLVFFLGCILILIVCQAMYRPLLTCVLRRLCSSSFFPARDSRVIFPCLYATSGNIFPASIQQRSLAHFNVAKFGQLHVRSEALCDFDIESVDPHLFPDQDHATFELDDGTDVSTKLDICCTTQGGSSRLVLDRCAAAHATQIQASACVVKIPIKYGKF